MNGKAKVLVVDDDKSILRTFTRLLEKNGYAVEVAETGREGLEKVEQSCFDVMLIDFRLPDMDGNELLLKSHRNIANAVKIMITGLPSLDMGSKMLDQGADAYLVKPVKPQELLVLIAEKLKLKRLQQNQK